MVGELFHARVEARKILAQLGQFVLDDVYLAARFDVLDDRTRGVQHRHQRGRRDDPHAAAHGVLDQIGVVSVNLGKHRFGGQKHHRTV